MTEWEICFNPKTNENLFNEFCSIKFNEIAE